MGALGGNGPTDIRKLTLVFENLGGGKFVKQMAQSMGAEAVALIKGGFDASQDPYGYPWAAVRRGGLPLRKTGRLRNAWTFKATRTSMQLQNALIQTCMMQYGTAGLPGGKLTPRAKKALSFDTPGVGKKRGTSWQPTVTVKSVVIPGRKMVPEMGDMPPRWEERLRATADKVMELIAKAQGGA